MSANLGVQDEKAHEAGGDTEEKGTQASPLSRVTANEGRKRLYFSCLPKCAA